MCMIWIGLIVGLAIGIPLGGAVFAGLWFYIIGRFDSDDTSLTAFVLKEKVREMAREIARSKELL